MKQINQRFTSIEQVADQYLQVRRAPKNTGNGDSVFRDILSDKLSGRQRLKFSKHASMRLNTRNITLSESQNTRLEAGVAQADEKGIRESLVLVDSLAFIVNVPSRTVVTAMDQTETDRNVFTNIDGAVIM